MSIENTRILYVAGRGQSGSTLLDVMLGYSASVLNVGEVLSGLNRGRAELCSCGVTVGSCEFWARVIDEYQRMYGEEIFTHVASLYQMSDIRRFPLALTGSSRKSKLYKVLNRQLLEVLGSISGRQVICDSNKEFTRAAELLAADSQAKAIHLYRDPVNVVASTYYRVRVKGLPFKFLKRQFYPKRSLFLACLLNAVAWNVGCIAGLVLEARYPGRVLRVKYETLVSDPEGTIKNIGQFAGLEVSGVLDELVGESKFRTKHSVGGNDLREAGVFRLERNTGGRRSMPSLYRVSTYWLTFPLVRTLASSWLSD